MLETAEIREVRPIRDLEQIEMMKRALLKKSYRDYFMFMFGINIGLRISDLLRLRVKDVKNRSNIEIREKKTKKRKIFRVSDGLRELIADYIQGMNDDDYLFPSKKTKKPITRVQAYRILTECAESCGIEYVGTHTLRKTYGYWFYKNRKDVAMLQKILNHSAPSVTLRYIGIEQEEIDEATESFSIGL